jgi:prepilin-type N-terminal cleavage/methylation domain-containing protein
MKRTRTQGFTLLELSIVLAIIATIVAAVMLGRTLVMNARLQTVITDVDSYISSVKNFQQTYQALPGDMPGATNVWGAVSTGCTTQQGTGTQTCNGDGNGQVGYINGFLYETYRFWQHLYNAGMFTQYVSGVSTIPGAWYFFQGGAVVGGNLPVGPFKGSGYTAEYWGDLEAVGGYTPPPSLGSPPFYVFTGKYGHVFMFGTASGGSATTYPVITPEQAANLDAKIDDGYPATGIVRTYYSAAANNCITGPATAASYNLSVTTVACALIFVSGF